MSVINAAPDPGIYLLADHLDAALAAGEDLIAETLPAAADREATGSPDDLPAYVARLARFEAALIARVLQARRRASELPRLEAHMRPVIQLIVSQSDSLLAIIDQFGDSAERRFMTGDDPLAFLRSRGLVEADAATLPRFDALKVTDTYKLAGTIELGPLLDMVSGTLEALDIAYDLFAEDADASDAGDVIQAEAPPGEDLAELTAAGDEARDPVADDKALTPSSLAQALQSLQRPGTAQ